MFFFGDMGEIGLIFVLILKGLVVRLILLLIWFRLICGGIFLCLRMRVVLIKAVILEVCFKWLMLVLIFFIVIWFCLILMNLKVLVMVWNFKGLLIIVLVVWYFKYFNCFGLILVIVKVFIIVFVWVGGFDVV